MLPAKLDIGEGHQIPGLAPNGLAEQHLFVGQGLDSLQIPVSDQQIPRLVDECRRMASRPRRKDRNELAARVKVVVVHRIGINVDWDIGRNFGVDGQGQRPRRLEAVEIRQKPERGGDRAERHHQSR